MLILPASILWIFSFGFEHVAAYQVTIASVQNVYSVMFTTAMMVGF